MKLSAEQLARLPWWAMFDDSQGEGYEVVSILPSDVYPPYLAHLGLKDTQYGMTIVRRILEEQLVRALVKMQVVRYTGANQFDELSEPMWSEDARIALAEYLPDATVGIRHANTDILHIRFLKQEDWDIRKKSCFYANAQLDEQIAQQDWKKLFFPNPLPSPL